MPYLEVGGVRYQIPPNTDAVRLLQDNGSAVWNLPSDTPSATDGQAWTYDAATRSWHPAAAGGGGSQLIDLGLINAVDALAGPVTLYTPTVGQLLEVRVSGDGFVEADSGQNMAVGFVNGPFAASAIADNQGLGFVVWGGNDSLFQVVKYNNPYIVPIVTGTTDPLVFFIADSSDVPLLDGVGWLANHAYSGKWVLLGPDGHLWSADSTGGTSGMSIPDFAGNESGNVVDNGYRGAITAVDDPSQTFTVAGNQTAFVSPADVITVAGSSGNNGTYTVISATPNGGATDIVVVEAIPDPTADGTLTSIHDGVLWTDRGSVPTTGTLHFWLKVS